MFIQYTEAEIYGQLRPGTYEFTINDVNPINTTDYNGNEITRLNLKLECVAGDMSVISTVINYPITVTSPIDTHQSIGRSILRNIARGVFPDSWQEKLKNLNVEELIGRGFSADVSYKNDKYIQLNKVRPTTLATLEPMDKADSSNSQVPF